MNHSTNMVLSDNNEPLNKNYMTMKVIIQILPQIQLL